MTGTPRPPAAAASNDSDLVAVSEVLRIVWHRKGTLLVCVCLALLLAVVYVVRAEPVYEVHSRLLVQQKSLPVDRQSATRRSDEFVATQAEIVQSPAVIRMAVEQLGMSSATGGAAERLLEALSRMKATAVPGTNVITVSYEGTGEVEAIAMVEAVIDRYRYYVHDLEKGAFRETLSLLTKNERELRGEIRALEEEYARIRQDSALLGQGHDSAGLQRSLLAELGRQIIETQNRRIELANQLESLLAAAEAGNVKDDFSSPAGTVLAFAAAAPDDAHQSASLPQGYLAQAQLVLEQTGREVTEIRGELREALSRDIAFAQKFEAIHPDRAAVREQIQNLEKVLAQRLAEAPGILRHELDSVSKQESQLKALYTQEFEKAKEADVQRIREEQTLGRIQRVQGIHDSILAQLRELELADDALSDGEARVRVSVLQEPAVVKSGVTPPPHLLFGASALLGLFSGCGLVTLLERNRWWSRAADAGGVMT